MIYFILLVVIAVLTFLGSDFSNTSQRSGNIVIACCIASIIVLFAGLRDGVWTDWEPYKYAYYNINKLDNDNELGFVMWNKLIGWFGLEYNAYLIISYTILLIAFVHTSYTVSRVFYLFSLLFLYTIYLLPSGGFRLFIAEIIILLSFSELVRKRYLYFLLCVLLAGFFHRTAWICFPIIFLQKFKVDYKYFFILLLIGFALRELNIFQFASDRVIENATSENLSSVTYRLNYYADDDESSLFNVTFLRRLFQCFLFIFLFKKCSERSPLGLEKIKMLRTLISIYLVGLLLKIFIPGIFARITGYFVITECIIVPLLMELLWKKQYKLKMAWFFLIILSVTFIHKMLTFYTYLFIPYKSVVLG